MRRFRLMPTTALALGAALAAAMPASADVFSSQGFSGETTTLNALPGVNLDAVPGFSGSSGNCVESEVQAFKGGATGSQKATTCQFGRFSVTTTGGASPAPRNDLIYGGNPPPWQQGWRP